MKNYSKNKKKQWKKSLKHIEKEINEAKSINRISNVGLDYAKESERYWKIKKNNKNSAKPFSSKEAVTESFQPEEMAEYEIAQEDFTDLWGQNKLKNETKRVLRKIETKELPIEGQSYNPDARDQNALLGYLVKQETKKEEETKKVKKFLEPLKSAQPTINSVDLALEFLKNRNNPEFLQETQNQYPDHELDNVVIKEKAPKVKNLIKLRRIELENIPKLKKQVKKEKKIAEENSLKKKSNQKRIADEKRILKETKDLAFSLPNEVPSCLRRLKPSTVQLAANIHTRKDKIPLKRTEKINLHSIKSTKIHRRNRKRFVDAIRNLGDGK